MPLNDAQIGLQVVHVRLDSLYKDEEFQVRLKLHEERVKDYMAMYEMGTKPALPPLDVADVKGILILCDGFHRVRAMELLGMQDAEATIRALPSIEEVKYQGAKANDAHGAAFNNKERFRMFKAYLRAGHHYLDGKPRDKQLKHMKSYREMATDFHVSHTAIQKWIERASPDLARFMSQRGMSQQDRDNFLSSGTRRPKNPAQLTPADLVRRGLQAARAAYPGVPDPTVRGMLIEQSEEVTKVMRSNTKFTMTEF